MMMSRFALLFFLVFNVFFSISGGIVVRTFFTMLYIIISTFLLIKLGFMNEVFIYFIDIHCNNFFSQVK